MSVSASLPESGLGQCTQTIKNEYTDAIVCAELQLNSALLMPAS